MANLRTACWDCNRGKGATRLDDVEDPGRSSRNHQCETCRIDVQMSGDLRRQTVVIRADRYGAGKTYTVVKPKEFKFNVALPRDWVKRVPWDQYYLYLSEKEQRAVQRHLDEVDKRLTKAGWKQVTEQEYRRRVK